MSDYLSDKEQVQLIKDWWKKYGNTVLLGIAVFLFANFGMRYWQQHQKQNSLRASETYGQLISAWEQGKDDQAKLYGNYLMKYFPRNTYASLAGLLLAKKAVEEDNLNESLSDLNWVIKHAENKSLRQIARIRAARVLASENKIAAGLKLLQTIDNEAYLTAIYEARGDLLLKQGDQKSASLAYQEALQHPASEEAPLLGMK
jgi:predicted negative regulator of RcsB-dependent stress response